MHTSRIASAAIAAAFSFGLVAACGGTSAGVDGSGGSGGSEKDAGSSVVDGAAQLGDGGSASADDAAATCASGPENTVAACSDGCDNDGDGFIDADDYDCCGIVPNAKCRQPKSACTFTPTTWSSAPLVDGETYHEVATASASFHSTAWIWGCNPSTITAEQTTSPPPGVRQLTFHIVVPADAPARTVLSIQSSVTSNVRYWTMLGSCGVGASCAAPPSTFSSADTNMASLVPGSDIYYQIECDDSSSDTVTMTFDLTNQ